MKKQINNADANLTEGAQSSIPRRNLGGRQRKAVVKKDDFNVVLTNTNAETKDKMITDPQKIPELALLFSQILKQKFQKQCQNYQNIVMQNVQIDFDDLAQRLAEDDEQSQDQQDHHQQNEQDESEDSIRDAAMGLMDLGITRIKIGKIQLIHKPRLDP